MEKEVFFASAAECAEWNEWEIENNGELANHATPGWYWRPVTDPVQSGGCGPFDSHAEAYAHARCSDLAKFWDALDRAGGSQLFANLTEENQEECYLVAVEAGLVDEPEGEER
jgi:hypothetical protein